MIVWDVRCVLSKVCCKVRSVLLTIEILQIETANFPNIGKKVKSKKYADSKHLLD